MYDSVYLHRKLPLGSLRTSLSDNEFIIICTRESVLIGVFILSYPLSRLPSSLDSPTTTSRCRIFRFRILYLGFSAFREILLRLQLTNKKREFVSNWLHQRKSIFQKKKEEDSSSARKWNKRCICEFLPCISIDVIFIRCTINNLTQTHTHTYTYTQHVHTIPLPIITTTITLLYCYYYYYN